MHTASVGNVVQYGTSVGEQFQGGTGVHRDSKTDRSQATERIYGGGGIWEGLRDGGDIL